MTQPWHRDPRAVLRALLVEKFHEFDCGCAAASHTEDVSFTYGGFADRALDLFPYITPREVRVRDNGTAWEPMQLPPTHVDFELRSEPFAAVRLAEGDNKASDLGSVPVEETPQ